MSTAAIAVKQIPQFHTACPVCGSGDLKPRWDVSSYKIVECSSCSLVFVQNAVTRQELDAYYASIFDPAYSDVNIDNLNFYYKALRKFIEKQFPNRGKILDIGCSRGYFLDIMDGWERHGNELIVEQARAAQERHGANIVNSSFEEYPLRQNYFDVITLQDVFDHFPEPNGVLQKCNRMLRPGGLIVVKVHNISCLYAKLSGKSFYALIPPAHLFYYNKKSLERIFRSSGFEVTGSKFYGHLLTLPTIFFRLAQSDTKSLAFRVGEMLRRTPLGKITVYKNLHDVITVYGKKPAKAR